MAGSNIAVVGTGIKCEARAFYNKAMPPKVPGEHLWILVGAWKCDPTQDRFIMDMENLLNVDGPGCFWCEQNYTEENGAKPCPGEPTR